MRKSFAVFGIKNTRRIIRMAGEHSGKCQVYIGGCGHFCRSAAAPKLLSAIDSFARDLIGIGAGFSGWYGASVEVDHKFVFGTDLEKVFHVSLPFGILTLNIIQLDAPGPRIGNTFDLRPHFIEILTDLHRL